MSLSVMRAKKRKPTLKDVASKAGVSISAVSQILNDRTVNFCSEEKKELVKQAAKELNYQPNFGYRVMTGMKTNTVGMVFALERIKNEEHITRLAMALTSKLDERGLSVYMATMGPESTDNFNKVLDLVNRGCSSFIFIGSPFGSEKMENYFEAHDIHYIGYNAFELKRTISVESSIAIKAFIDRFLEQERRNFKLLVPLINQGHGRLAGLFKAFPHENENELIRKYCVSMPSAGVNESLQDIYTISYERTRKIMEADNSINGIIYLSDYYALVGAKYLLDNGYVVGKDVAVCGYNNTNAARFFPYPVSTADHNIPKLCDGLISELDSQSPLKQNYEPETILR